MQYGSTHMCTDQLKSPSSSTSRQFLPVPSHFGNYTGNLARWGDNGRLIGQESRSKLTKAEKKSRIMAACHWPPRAVAYTVCSSSAAAVQPATGGVLVPSVSSMSLLQRHAPVADGTCLWMVGVHWRHVLPVLLCRILHSSSRTPAAKVRKR
jgi:hypothetical protein